MNTNDLNMALYEKMAAEQDKFRDWLKSQPPEEILHHTYEYTVREDIVMAMEELELTDAQAKALLESPAPLADVYRYFGKLETGYMDVIRDSIENRANDAVSYTHLDVYKRQQANAFCCRPALKGRTSALYRNGRKRACDYHLSDLSLIHISTVSVSAAESPQATMTQSLSVTLSLRKFR